MQVLQGSARLHGPALSLHTSVPHRSLIRFITDMMSKASFGGGMSVWTATTRERFEDDVTALHKISPFQDAVSLRERLPPKTLGATNTDCQWLPANTERQLADHYAFLAAWKPDPGCVAAAAVSQGNDDVVLLVNIAANDEIDETVLRNLQSMASQLRTCAAGGMSVSFLDISTTDA